MDGWNTTFLLGRPIFRGYVSFREGNPLTTKGFLFSRGDGIQVVPFVPLDSHDKAAEPQVVHGRCCHC